MIRQRFWHEAMNLLWSLRKYISKSSFCSVKKIAEDHSFWGIRESTDRREIQIQNISGYLYGDKLLTELAKRSLPVDALDMPNILYNGLSSFW